MGREIQKKGTYPKRCFRRNRKLKYLKIMKIINHQKRKFSHLRPVKIQQQQNSSKINLEKPVKIVSTKKPRFQIPHNVETTMHGQKKIDYEDRNLFFLFPIRKFLSTRDQQGLHLSVPQMEMKHENVQTPDLVLRNFDRVHKINLWMYKGRRISEWHYDCHDNFLYILSGTKTIYLAKPNSLNSRSIFSTFNNHIDKSKISKRFTAWKTKVRQGECLFIPKGWWHFVSSSGEINVALNFWGNSISSTISGMKSIEKKLILKQLLLENLDQILFNHYQKQWEEIDESSKQFLRLKLWNSQYF